MTTTPKPHTQPSHPETPRPSTPSSSLGFHPLTFYRFFVWRMVIFYFFQIFFKKKCVSLCLFLSRCTHSLDILLFNVFHQRFMVIMFYGSSLGPWVCLVPQKSGAFVGNPFKKGFYPSFLRKLHHFGGESTMSIVLHLVIKPILHTQCCQLRSTQ